MGAYRTGGTWRWHSYTVGIVAFTGLQPTSLHKGSEEPLTAQNLVLTPIRSLTSHFLNLDLPAKHSQFTIDT